MKRFRRRSDDVLDLAAGNTGRQQCEDSASDVFRINARIAVHGFVDTLANGRDALRRRMRAWMPAFVIKAAQ